MYRLLIVDDEEIIVNGLYDILSNLDSVDLEVYRAYSGEEAIAWLSRTRIDIVLTDINMPEIDGIQLLDEIKKRWSWCRVIFLTGHSEFNYAYKAIQYSNVSYILKTEGYDKIIRTVEAVFGELRDENEANEMIQNAKDQINLAKDLFCQKYFTALLNNDTTLQISQQEFERLYVNLNSEEPVMLVLGKILSLPKTIDFWEKNQIMYSIKQMIVRYFAMHVNCLVIPLSNGRIAIFVQMKKTADYPEQNDVSTSMFLKGTLELVQSACREKLKAPINFVLAESFCKWKDVAEKYVELIDLLSKHINHDVETIIDESEYRKQRQTLVSTSENTHDNATTQLQKLLYSKNLNNLYQYVEMGEEEEYFNSFEKWLEPLSEIQDKNDVIALETYHTLITFFLSCINRAQLAPQFSVFCNINKLHDSENYTSWKEAADHLADLSHKLFYVQKEEEDKRTNEIILFVQQYIETHLAEDLSLTSLSEKTYLNPSYLSRLYHQTTGHKLSAFIETTRINKAKELLENPNEKVYEIAKKVGYDAATSFTRLFKKVEGISPLEYKNLVQVSIRQEKHL